MSDSSFLLLMVLLLLSRYILHGMINEMSSQRERLTVLMIIHLSFSSGQYVGIPCSPWRSVHIDTISPLQGQPIMISRMRGRKICDIIKAEVEEEEPGVLPLVPLVKSLVTKAASLIKGGNPERSVLRIDKFLQAFQQNSDFQTITLQKIVELLQLKDSQVEESSSWLSKVSLDSSKLKEGSTYQAAVWHRLQECLAPLLAIILSNIDCNYNLDILASPDNWKVDLFLKIYRSISFEVTSVSKITLLKSSHGDFTMRLPFSWRLIQLVRMMPSDLSLSDLANVSPVIKHLQEAMAAGGSQIVEDFVHDLLYNSLTVPSPVNGKLIEKWLLSEIRRESAGTGAMSPMLIVSVFNKLKEHIRWFNQLTESYPDIVNDVMDSVKGDTVLTPLSETALKFAIKTLSPDNSRQLWDNFYKEDVREEWKMKVYHLQSVAQQMKQVTGDKLEAGGLWGEWTQCVVFLNFMQNVLTQTIDGKLKLSVCNRLKTVWMTLKEPDLKKHSSFHKLVRILQIINKEAAKIRYPGGVNECAKCQEVPRHPVALPCGDVACKDCLLAFFKQREEKRCPNKKCKTPNLPENFTIDDDHDVEEAVRNHHNLRKNLNVFFLDTLKNFCFAVNERPPEKKILQSLLEFVTFKSISEGDGDVRTKELSPFDEHGIDDNPTIRSFLLQLCLQSDRGFSNDLISDFMVFRRGQAVNEEETVELVHLYINCVEDRMDKALDSSVIFQDPPQLDWGQDNDFTDLEKLNKLAQCKVGLEILARVLVTYFEEVSSKNKEVLMKQITSAMEYVANSSPEFRRFLVKEICFKHRADVINKMKKQKMFGLLPEELHKKEDEVEDILNIAGPLYPRMKKLIRNFFVGNYNQDELKLLMQRKGKGGAQVLILALFDKVATNLGDNLNRETCQRLIDCAEEFSPISLDSIFRVKNLTDLPQRNIDLIKIAYLAKTVCELNEPSGGISELFSVLITAPGTLENKFLPSMPHDVQFEALKIIVNDKQAHSGQLKFFECPKGHVFGVGDCGKPSESGTCAECGAPIGGSRPHVLMKGCREMGDTVDTTKRGYVIQADNNNSEGVRTMNPFYTEFFRMLFHIGCLAGLYDKAEEVSHLCQVEREDTERYLLEKININICKCANIFNISQDNIVILLADFFNNIPDYVTDKKFDLLHQNERYEWEEAFVRQLKQNIDDNKLTETIETFKAVVREDSEKSALQELLCAETSKLSRVLRVRSRVTADTLLQWLTTNERLGSSPTLGRMLKNMTVLQELVNLPDILRFQCDLLDRFSGKMSNTEMEKMKIMDFSEKIDKNSRPRFLQQAEVVLQTWNTLKVKVGQHRGILAGQVTGTEVFTTTNNTIRNTPAAFLFPANKGSGLCSLALVMFMVDSHNMLAMSTMPTLNPYQASVYHLAAFSKSDLQSLLLSHTSYTFPRSGFTKEEYDVEGMERKLVEKFVLSKPRLEGEVRKVQYLEDRSSREEDLLTKKITQTQLDNNVQHQLELELRELPDLCQLLESVCTARDFLLEVGGDPDTSLPAFMVRIVLGVMRQHLISYSMSHHIWTFLLRN